MADLVTDLLIYICFGIVMFAIGMIIGYQPADNALLEAFLHACKGVFRCRFRSTARGRTGKGDLRGFIWLTPLADFLIGITCLCFGLIVSFQIAHIRYCRKLTVLVRRSISTKTIAPGPR